MDLPTWDQIISQITTAVSSNQFFQGGAVLGMLVFLGQSLKSIPQMIWSRISRLIFYTVNIEEIDELFYYFEVWLSKNHGSKYRNVEASLELRKDISDKVRYVYKEDEEEEEKWKEGIIYKQFNDLFHIRRGINYIRIVKSRQKLENASNLKSAFYNKFEISSLFSKKAINRLLDEVHAFNTQLKTQEREKNILVKSCDSWGNWEKESVIEPKPIEKVYVENLDVLTSDITKFLRSREWYRKNSILYKRGYMFSGPPGNGKTTLTIALAKHFKRSVNFLKLNNLTDDSLKRAFRNLSPDSILVIEDIDSAFTERKAKETTEFSFSTFLNCLDGVFSKDNLIVIFTTNHPERLDPALIREGRIDIKFEFNNPNKEIISQYLSNYFDKPVVFSDANYSCKLPMVSVQNICIKNRGKSETEIKEILIKEDSEFVYNRYNVIPEKPEKKNKKVKLRGKLEEK